MKELVDEFMKPSQVLQYVAEKHDDALVFHCRGAFSLVSHGRLEELIKDLRNTGQKRIVLDLLEVVHIDSTGVGTLAAILKETLASNRVFVIIPSNPVRDILATACLDKVFKYSETVADAVRVA